MTHDVDVESHKSPPPVGLGFAALRVDAALHGLVEH